MKTIESITERDISIVEIYIKNNAPNLHLFLMYDLDEVGDNTKINDTERFLRENGVEFYENLHNAINNKGEDELIIREIADKKYKRNNEKITVIKFNPMDLAATETGNYFVISKELFKKIIILDDGRTQEMLLQKMYMINDIENY